MTPEQQIFSTLERGRDQAENAQEWGTAYLYQKLMDETPFLQGVTLPGKSNGKVNGKAKGVRTKPVR